MAYQLLVLYRLSVHPHLRGAYAAACSRANCACRFIPTCVGHTYCSRLPISSFTGSFPPAWGIPSPALSAVLCVPVHPHLRGAYHDWSVQRFADLRFIPTCVGHTHQLENKYGSEHGSSPPAWGIRLLLLFEDVIQTVHPHLRGAYSK